MADADFPLPSLAPRLRLTRAPDERGEPAYTLHDPVANSYFRIDWVAFECLSRMTSCRSAAALRDMVERETTLTVTMAQIADIVSFLGKNGLLSLRDQDVAGVRAEMPLWKKIFHRYLFFSLPLFQPQGFLERTYKYLRWAYHPLFIRAMLLFLAVMMVMTALRLDEFMNSFAGIMSAEGVLAVLIVFGSVKIVHEFAHAYTAVRYGVRVPHMGVAFMVMYPVLYTETTGSWILASRRERFHIGVAGITAELWLAALALAVWQVAPAGGMAQTLAFLVVAVSMAGSLLVNLNPLMRFDGYYMLSDATGFDNLQHRACAFARYSLRRVLFGWADTQPEDLPQRDVRFLTLFGFALLVYRFFLFMGIGILVYHVFFQPLGFMLMVLEIGWFIGLPVWNELRVWWRSRDRLMSAGRGRVSLMALVLILAVLVVPWRTTTALPAMIHASSYEVMYTPYAARIAKMEAEDGQEVAQGDILAVLESPALDHDSAQAQRDVERLENLRRRAQAMPEALRSDELSMEALDTARRKLAALRDQQDRLIMRAPFSGKIRDKGAEIVEGRYVMAGEALFSVVNTGRVAVTAYATESQRETIRADDSAIFLSIQRDRRAESLRVRSAATAGTTTPAWPELVSIHGGPLAADPDEKGQAVTRRTLYEISATGDQAAPGESLRGTLQVQGPARSILSSWIKDIVSLGRREAGI